MADRIACTGSRPDGDLAFHLMVGYDLQPSNFIKRMRQMRVPPVTKSTHSVTIGAMSSSAKKLGERLRSPEFLTFASAKAGIDYDRLSLLVSQYTAEVASGFSVLAGAELAGKRILEVGAGIGVLSIALAQDGHNITALEPGANGFDVNAQVGAAVREWLAAEDLPILDIEVDRLEPAKYGKFDLIFSVNVLEHIPDLSAAIAAMKSVLAPHGMMVHLCPNYTVPYEPHFGIPLVPFAPRITGRLVPGIDKHPAWPSINFITHGEVQRLAARFGLLVTFRRGLMYDAFVRLDTDQEFGARHTGMVRRIYRLLKTMRILSMLRHVPPALATPMIFECRHVQEINRVLPREIAANP
jgi:2-polyprenyl-3-methyl-5-hydroxy-6-metoxy-1,4-benzoquinol methylase